MQVSDPEVVEHHPHGLRVRAPDWLTRRLVAAFLIGSIVVVIAWLAVAVSGGKSHRPAPRVSAQLRVVQTFYFGDTLPGGLKVVGDGNEVQIGTGPRRTWLNLDALGLPPGYMFTVAVGRCIAGHPHQVDAQTAIAPVGDESELTYSDHLRLIFANLPIAADDPTDWVTFSAVHGGGLHGRYYGGIQGALSKYQQATFGANLRPCST